MILRLLIIFTLTISTGCGESSETTPPSKKKDVASVTPPVGVFTPTRPADAPGISEVKKTAKKGDTVRFLGRVGGKVEPFVSGNAIFVATDSALVSCELKGDEDHCAVPWDYCCEDADDLRGGMATVRLVDTSGRPLRATARGMGGLEESKFVLIEGLVHDRNDDGLFIVDASSIWVGGKPNRTDPLKGSR